MNKEKELVIDRINKYVSKFIKDNNIHIRFDDYKSYNKNK